MDRLSRETCFQLTCRILRARFFVGFELETDATVVLLLVQPSLDREPDGNRIRSETPPCTCHCLHVGGVVQFDFDIIQVPACAEAGSIMFDVDRLQL